MITRIQHIKNFGVFRDYAWSADMKDFKEKNIIYGWNYSGKTTLSRLFSLLELKAPLSDFPNVQFSFADAGGDITEKNLAASNKIVRVFNSEFAQDNLSWQGDQFDPILLVGKDSIDTEKEIARLKLMRDKSSSRASERLQEASKIQQGIDRAMTDAAASIKVQMAYVPAFDARHLGIALNAIASDPESFQLTPEQLDVDLKLAKTADEDKRPPISPLNHALKLDYLRYQAEGLLSQVPAAASIIEYLRNDPDVGNWVQAGLPLHEHKNNCAFCGNILGAMRLNELRAHFSKDMTEHVTALSALLSQLDSEIFVTPGLSTSFLYPQFHKRAEEVGHVLSETHKTYNGLVRQLINAVSEKIRAPFQKQAAPVLDSAVEQSLRDALASLDALIDESNAVSQNFSSKKGESIERLKRHFAYTFRIDKQLPDKYAAKARFEKHVEWLNSVINHADAQVKVLSATINQAQKGREEINKLISELLGGDGIQIDVVQRNGIDRFQLVRRGEPARYMSEGEKTAVAFAFFLTKLSSDPLADTIVYIDDPISSLDSNHIFQVVALIKRQFVYKDTSDDPHGTWKMRCKQLFVSTHNFEFFSLLRELKAEKKTNFYMTKRMSEAVSTFGDLPKSILHYSSEYHYLFNIIHQFYIAPDKTKIEVLLSLPNAVRRFVELYTYARYPNFKDSTIDQRVEHIWGDRAAGIVKVFHYFSHGQNIERLAGNNDMICNVESAVRTMMELLKEDKMHYEALEASVV